MHCCCLNEPTCDEIQLLLKDSLSVVNTSAVFPALRGILEFLHECDRSFVEHWPSLWCKLVDPQREFHHISQQKDILHRYWLNQQIHTNSASTTRYVKSPRILPSSNTPLEVKSCRTSCSWMTSLAISKALRSASAWFRPISHVLNEGQGLSKFDIRDATWWTWNIPTPYLIPEGVPLFIHLLGVHPNVWN